MRRQPKKGRAKKEGRELENYLENWGKRGLTSVGSLGRAERKWGQTE